LPISHPEELVSISDPSTSGMNTGIEGGERTLFSYHEFEGLRDHANVFSSLAAFSSEPRPVKVRTTETDEGSSAYVTMVSGSFFPMLGIQPAAGGLFGPEIDAVRMANPVAVVSDRFWQTRLDGDPAPVGRTIRINRDAFTIVGVLKPAFTGLVVGDAPDVYVPLTMQPAVILGPDLLTQPPGVARRVMFLHVVGRLKPGVALADARIAVNEAFHRDIDAEAALVTDPRRRNALMESSATVHEARYGLSPLRAEYRDPLLVLMTLVGLLLLLACANVANLLLARATGRRRELVLRVALGAGRARLIRQLLTEAVVLAGLGTLAGVALSRLGIAVLLRLVAGGNVPVPLDTPADWRVLLFLVGTTAVTAVLAGLIPAIRATRLDLNAALRGSAANVAGSGRGSGRWAPGKVLAGVQVALSLVLLVVAGLFVRTLMNLGSVELGYDPAPLAMFRVNAAAAGVTPTAAQPFFEDLLTKLAAMPRVKSVSLSENGLFYGGDMNVGVSFPGQAPPSGEPDIRLDMIGPAYFTTTGIPVVLGRDMQASDAGGLQGCWLNQSGVTRYFGANSPMGQRMTIHYSFGDREYEVRGVVADARGGDLRSAIPARAYVPFFPALPNFSGGAIVEMRVAGDPMAIQPDVRRLLQSINSAVPPPTVHTVPELIGLDLTTNRLTARLSMLFGALALILAAAGIYGVLSYSVSRRVTEIGVRLALGAERGAILRMVAAEALGIGVAGALVGLAVSLGVTRYIGTMLFGLGARDPWTIAIGVFILLAVALTAAALPAWRAAKTDPIRALRAD
ncbi:MAG TPA: ADOP family duplicated permease, partial [Vicinamibacterales bacterium]|nr:ADOP family duplicated permease [Vicinamibacterales bacterium]